MLLFRCTFSLKLVLIESPRSTPALAYLDLNYFKSFHLDSMNQIEFCPSAGSLTERICKDFKDHPGIALLIDYGDTQPFQNSLRVSSSYVSYLFKDCI